MTPEAALTNAPPLDSSWLKYWEELAKRPYMVQLRQFLHSQWQKGATIYPDPELYFSAFQATPLNQVKVVILGQDPYHNPEQAHGLSFSVRPGLKIPPSLRNIYKEIERDLGITPSEHGFLKSWSQQGVLLLNSVLTVEKGKPASHRNKGWELFTDEIMKIVNENTKQTVFLLWGSYAQKKGQMLDRKKHLVLEAAHPSPLSARRGFSGCSHFSLSNEYLKKHGKIPIDWSLPDLSNNKQGSPKYV